MSEEIPGFDLNKIKMDPKGKRALSDSELRLQTERELYEQETRNRSMNDKEFTKRIQNHAASKNLFRARVNENIISSKIDQSKITGKEIAALTKAREEVEEANKLLKSYLNVDSSKPREVKKEQKVEDLSPAERLDRDLAGVNRNLQAFLNVSIRGSEESPGVFKPWPLIKLRESFNGILRILDYKVELYQGAGDTQKAQETLQQIEVLKNLLSELDGKSEVPEGFLQRVKDTMEKYGTIL